MTKKKTLKIHKWKYYGKQQRKVEYFDFRKQSRGFVINLNRFLLTDSILLTNYCCEFFKSAR